MDYIAKLKKIEAATKPTDQTRIPQILDDKGNPMEVQAIRSERNDMKRDLEAYGKTLANVRADAAQLVLDFDTYKKSVFVPQTALGKTLYDIAKSLG